MATVFETTSDTDPLAPLSNKKLSFFYQRIRKTIVMTYSFALPTSVIAANCTIVFLHLLTNQSGELIRHL